MPKKRYSIAMEFQTRNGAGECKLFGDFSEAFMEYERDPTVWKISWENHRFRPKTKAALWDERSEEKLSELCKEYAECKDLEAIFWVDQSIMVPDFKKFDVLDRRLSHAEISYLEDIARLKACMTQKTFLKKFSA